MKLVEFSVTNYRSITKAHKINLKDLTVLVGKNNEGKSNLLTAINVAMTVIINHSGMKGRHNAYFYKSQLYLWERDFPMQFQRRPRGLESIFRLNFHLEGDETSEFQKETGIRGNDDISIEIKIDKNNNTTIRVPKKGSSSYTKKSMQVTSFISKRISFNYIEAIRTEGMALKVLRNVILNELQELENDKDYIEAYEKIKNLQQKVLDGIAAKLLEPLKTFLPELKTIKIQRNFEETMNQLLRNEIDVVIDDGYPTSISVKGDGIKSLVTLAILKDRKTKSAASIIAIEEPESHLHSGAIHGLVDVINRISVNNQVIITTHNPLFVQQNKIKSNIIINGGTAHPARSIVEIRDILGVLPADNLRNASHVFVVEGENDKIALAKIISVKSEKLNKALKTNYLVIKALGGASNLSHEITNLKNSMCKFFVLLDNDKAGIEASDKAKHLGLLKDSEIKFTICNGSPESEFEDCLKKEIYEEKILDKFGVRINVNEFKNNKKWSERIKNVFRAQGARWSDEIEKKLKMHVAESVTNDMSSVLNEHKSGFIDGVVTSLENMITEMD